MTDAANRTVVAARDAIQKILNHEDRRVLAVVGPCSIHDTKAAIEYASMLNELRRELADRLCIIMRVYFEKPRTTVGWKGFLYDPRLDGSEDLAAGLRLARRLLVEINEMGMPTATELLDPITPQYIADLISWGAIGARTTESQVHRELASGLSCPVGFKNGTDGNIRIAVDAIKAAASPHHFLSVTKAGHSAIISTSGNEDCHVILRGGKQPNYDAPSVDAACKELATAGLAPRVMIDCSHANCRKQFKLQLDVASDVAGQLAAGDQRIIGLMVESHLNEGRQDLESGQELEYGKSITDPCLGWQDSVELLNNLAEGVRARRRLNVDED
jgi:3-deoxy-7-phosphoheptulonate synthase